MASIDKLLDRADKATTRSNIDARTLQDNLSILQELKGAVAKGELSVTDFQSYLEPIIKKSETITSTIARQGSAAANSVNPIWSAFQSENFVQPVNGRWVTTLPFTRREYSQLPENVLPTQEDVNNGLFDPTYAPLNRLRPSTGGVQTPGSPTDGTLPSAPSTVTSPAGGTTGGTTAGGRDEAQLIAEAELQKQLAAEAAAARENKRKSYLTELGGLLDQSNQQAFDLARPDIYEDLNRRGLLLSSETGKALANKQGELQQARDIELSKQGLLYSDEATNDLKSINERYLADRQNAISRRYSLEDYARQIQAGKEMGEYAASLTPRAESGKSVRDQQMWQAGLMTVNTAAQAGSKAATKGATP